MFARLLTRSYQQQQQGGSVSFQTFLPNSSALVNNFPLFILFFRATLSCCWACRRSVLTMCDDAQLNTRHFIWIQYRDTFSREETGCMVKGGEMFTGLEAQPNIIRGVVKRTGITLPFSFLFDALTELSRTSRGDSTRRREPASKSADSVLDMYRELDILFPLPLRVYREPRYDV
jgi:hypothetical protein